MRGVAKKTAGEVRRAKPATGLSAAEKAADAAARKRVAATLDLDAFAATLPTTAGATAKHWTTPD